MKKLDNLGTLPMLFNLNNHLEAVYITADYTNAPCDTQFPCNFWMGVWGFLFVFPKSL